MREIFSHIILPKQSVLSRWAEALPVLLSSNSQCTQTDDPPLAKVSIRSDSNFSGKAFLSSCFLHILFFSFLMYGTSNLLVTGHQRSVDRSVSPQEQIIYYDLRATDLEKLLPNRASHAMEGKTGRGRHSLQTSPRSGDTFHPQLTMAMHPPKPDSIHQTILEPAAPPDLKIARDIKLPNIVIDSVSPPLRPPLSLSLQKPFTPKRHDSVLPAPGIVQEANWKKETFHSALAAMTLAPALPVPTFRMPHPKSKTSGPSGKTDAKHGLPSAAPPLSLIAVSTEPGALQTLLAVPLGNRYGTFSVSPAGGHPTASGVNVGGDATEGSGGGSEASSSAEEAGGGTKGGGNTAAGSSALRVSGGLPEPSGTVAVDAGNRTLAGAVTAGEVFPVLTPLRVRGLNIQVFSGPTGGGGLAVYGVLPCGKIYTIPLAMPRKDWILQYCTHDSDDLTQSENTTNHFLHLDRGLVAPDPTAKFDFKRTALPSERTNTLIILRGAISEDGSVTDVTVLRGADPKVDTLAAAAFRRWKFQPALRSGKPVRVEVLVGVPASMS
jgi:TonB family protein